MSKKIKTTTDVVIRTLIFFFKKKIAWSTKFFFKRKHKSKTTYAVQVRRKGFRTVSKSFDTRTEAKRWARNMEAKLDRGDYSDYTEASKLTLGDLFKA